MAEKVRFENESEAAPALLRQAYAGRGRETEIELESEIEIETETEVEIEEEKELVTEEEQRQREESGDFGPIIIQCDICHDHKWRIAANYVRGKAVMADLHCTNGRLGAIGIEERYGEKSPAKISTESNVADSDILITCGHCGHTNKFKTHGWFKVLYPKKGENRVTIECSCGKTYILTTYDSHQIGRRPSRKK